jgi:ABC-type nitrate/sulfonate/bicarbonate transport system substrate-binding protein
MLLSALLVFVSGCSNKEEAKSASGTTGKQYDVIKLATPSDITSPSLYYVGEELGFFEQEGIKLEYVGVIPSTQLVASVVAGKLDVGGAHINRTIAGISAGAKIKAVIANTETTQAIPHMVYATLESSSIKTAQDLIGKKIGIPLIGGCNEYIPYAYMNKNGITDPKSKVQMIVMPESNLEQALRQGDIDVIGMHKIPGFIAERGGLRLLFSDYDAFGNIGGSTPAYFSEKFIQEKPDVVRRFVTAMAKTINWANANQQKAIDITVKRANIDPKQLRTGYWAPDGIIKDETVTVWIKLLKEFGEIKGEVKPEQIYTNEFNSNAKI